MKTLFRLLSCVAALCWMTTGALAQVVSSGITGTVSDPAGKPLAGAAVTAVYLPTNATFRGVSNTDGRFYLRGLPSGGPYTLTATAEGYQAGSQSDIETQLGQDIGVDLTVKSEVVQLDKLVVASSRDDLDPNATGAGTVLTSQKLNAKPTTQRSLADVISASPLVTLRALSGDREEAAITAVGQNNRYNSIQIDGSRINDQFGLNSTGLASFFNPLSLDTVDQLAVQVSPYDTRQAGFTGASINAVTKSGTNKFAGSAYYYFAGDSLGGVQMQSRDVAGSTKGIVPSLERITKGFTFSGPIWKDKLFFFFNYEKFSQVKAPSDAYLTNIDGTQLSNVLAKFDALNAASGENIEWGNIADTATNTASDKKILAKVDWNITNDHRLAVRYSKTDGTVPQFGKLSSASSSYSTGGTPSSIANSGATALSSNFYDQDRIEEAWTTQLFSQWTANLKTELRYAKTTQDQLTPNYSTAPEVYINGFTGVNRAGTTINNGLIVAGTEYNRHGNQINVDTSQYSATADYVWNNVVFTGGLEREENSFFNLYRAGSYGTVYYSSVANFLADTPVMIQRNVIDPAKRPAGDVSDFATNGLFVQAKLDVTPRLNLLAGLRYEFQQVDDTPAFNEALFTTTGFRNDGTMDGVGMISPRIGFNYALKADRSMQLRGGVGHFSGRAPWVFFSNSFNQLGVGSFTKYYSGMSLQSYLTNEFDASNPIGTATDNGTGRREVDWMDNNIKMPSLWRANLAFETKVPAIESNFSIEAVYSRNDESLFIRNENLKKLVATSTSGPSIGLDGRQRYSGSPSTQANALYTGYTNLYHITNVKNAGESTYVTLQLERPMKNNWAYSLAYTRGKATDSQNMGQTTAGSQYARQMVFNQGEVEVGTSDFEIKDRVQASYARRFNIVKGNPTTVALYYEGRSGNPYSFAYSNDINGDGSSGNDRIYVPTGADDAKMDFSALSSAQVTAFFDFLDSSGLSKYAGMVAPKNTHTQPWVNRLDLKFSQRIPLRLKTAELELFFDWTNFGAFISRDFFGYYEEVQQMSYDLFRRRYIGAASYNSTGQIKMTSFAPETFVFDNTQSRWRINVGAKLKF